MEKTKQELIEITSNLIALNTVNPPGNESCCTPFIRQKMEDIGLKVKVAAKKKRRENVIGKIGRGGKSLIIACHMDTVAPGEGWKTDPFKAVVKNGKIYGRGAIDDKGPFAISYCAVKAFLQKHRRFPGTIYLASLADEEADNIYGAKYLLKRGLYADAALIPDGGHFSKLDCGEKGCLQLRIDSFGKQEHSALQEKGQNAIENLAVLITTLKRELKFSKYDKRFTPLKINVSKFHGGDIANVIPSRAWTQMDIRYPLRLSSQKVFNKIKKIAKTISRGKKQYKFAIIYSTEPHIVHNEWVIEAFMGAAKELSLTIKPALIAGNTVAKEFNQAGIPAIAHYPMDKITAHEPNEHIKIGQMIKTTRLYTKFLERFFQLA